MASTDTLTRGRPVYTGNHGWSRDTKSNSGIHGYSDKGGSNYVIQDTLTRGVDQYILASIDGPGIPE